MRPGASHAGSGRVLDLRISASNLAKKRLEKPPRRTSRSFFFFLPISRRCFLSSDAALPFPLHLSHPGGFHGVKQRRVPESRFANDTRTPRFPVRGFLFLLSFVRTSREKGFPRILVGSTTLRTSIFLRGSQDSEKRRALCVSFCIERGSRGREPDGTWFGHAIATKCNCK